MIIDFTEKTATDIEQEFDRRLRNHRQTLIWHLAAKAVLSGRNDVLERFAAKLGDSIHVSDFPCDIVQDVIKDAGSLLTIAVMANNRAAVEILMKHGAAPEEESRDPRFSRRDQFDPRITALDLAVQTGRRNFFAASLA